MSSIRQSRRNIESAHELQEIEVVKHIPLGSALVNEETVT